MSGLPGKIKQPRRINNTASDIWKLSPLIASIARYILNAAQETAHNKDPAISHKINAGKA